MSRKPQSAAPARGLDLSIVVPLFNEVATVHELHKRLSDVLLLIMRQGMSLALIGLAGGLLVGFGAARLIVKLLFGVNPTDPITFVGVTVLLGLVAALACYIPARRATKVDPLVALRYE